MPGRDKMRFRKLGGKFQLEIDSPESLEAVCSLDEAHWMCTGAPIESFTCDLALLKYLDSDGNGRIRTDEIKKAVKWLLSTISDRTVLTSDTDEFPLDAIDTSCETGKQLRSSAERILSNLKIENRDIIKLEHTRSRQDILSSGECNGDGVIPLSSVQDESLRGLIKDVMDTTGSVTDAGGEEGITSEYMEKFIDDVKAYLEWYENGALLKKGKKSGGVMVWGKETVSAYAALKAVRDKIDEYFSQCRLVKINRDAFMKALHPEGPDTTSVNITSKEEMDIYIASSPLAPPDKEEKLLIDSDIINPFYRDMMETFNRKVLTVFNKKSNGILLRSEWEIIKKEFAEFAEWEAGKPGESVESIEIERLQSYRSGELPEKLKPLFEKDLAVAEEIKKIGEVEKLLLYCGNLMEFTNNFVSFFALFNPESMSMIQVGKLVMDARHFDLNVKVKDIAQHKKIAKRSNICVMYLKLTAKDGEQIMIDSVATAVTSGNILNLYIGKRGVFFTPDGREWDAEVVDFIDQPVSVTEALKMPFIKFGGFIRKQTEKFTSATYSKLESGAANAGASLTVPPPSAPPPPKSSWTGPLMLLGGGIGIAGLGSAFASVINALKDNAVILKISLFLIGILLVIAIPIVISAIMKLRRRNIGMFLEACGWSINTSMRLNLKLGLLFTRTPHLPLNSEKIRLDYSAFLLKKADFQEKIWKSRLILIILTLLLSLIAGYYLRKMFNIDMMFGNSTSVQSVPERQQL